jgi:hypothetical protein
MRLIAFVLCGMRLSFNYLMYFMLAKFLWFIKSNLLCFLCFWGYSAFFFFFMCVLLVSVAWEREVSCWVHKYFPGLIWKGDAAQEQCTWHTCKSVHSNCSHSVCCVAKASLLHTPHCLCCNLKMTDTVHEGDYCYCMSWLLITTVNGNPKLDKYYLSFGDSIQSDFHRLTAASGASNH